MSKNNGDIDETSLRRSDTGLSLQPPHTNRRRPL